MCRGGVSFPPQISLKYFDSWITIDLDLPFSLFSSQARLIVDVSEAFGNLYRIRVEERNYSNTESGLGRSFPLRVQLSPIFVALVF